MTGKKDPRVDSYIEAASDFAQPILQHIRKLVHIACPAVEETLKWGMPHFVHKGILCGMAAFKQHCALHFRRGDMIFGERQESGQKEAMGQFGRITAILDLPSEKMLLTYIKKAVHMNEEGIKPPPRPNGKKQLTIPTYFMAALKKNQKALVTFENFSYTHRKEYVQWVNEAK